MFLASWWRYVVKASDCAVPRRAERNINYRELNMGLHITKTVDLHHGNNVKDDVMSAAMQ